jgi:hypothetical protein
MILEKVQSDPELGLAENFYLEEFRKTDEAPPPGTSCPFPILYGEVVSYSLCFANTRG